MKTIWKFPLALTDKQTIRLPAVRKTLTTMVQHGIICLWAEVDDEHPHVDAEVRIVGTGRRLPEGDFVYVGSVLMEGGDLVWHVYIELEDLL